jgi:hypothetical protein
VLFRQRDEALGAFLINGPQESAPMSGSCEPTVLETAPCRAHVRFNMGRLCTRNIGSSVLCASFT